MTDKPKVSFVVPTKNRVEWLAECLSGLLCQTVKEIEVVVVNDGSTDGTKEFLDDFWSKYENIKIIHNPVSVGGGMSRNIGMEAASADIIGVCDDDDVYPLERASKILEFFEKHKEGCMMNPPYVHVDYFNTIIERFDGKSFDYEAFKKGEEVYFCNPGAAYLKKDMQEIGGYPSESVLGTDDIQMLKKWVDSGKKVTYYPPNYLCMHRVLPDSMMVKFRGFDPNWNSK